MIGWSGTSVGSSERQAGGEAEQNAAHDPLLPASKRRVPAQPLRQRPGRERQRRAEGEACQRNDRAEQNELQEEMAALRLYELWDEGEEEERDFRIQEIGRQRAPECDNRSEFVGRAGELWRRLPRRVN